MNENAFAIQNDVIQSLKREGKFDKYRNQIKDKLINNEGYVKRTIVSFLKLKKFFETPIPILQNSTVSLLFLCILLFCCRYHSWEKVFNFFRTLYSSK